MPNAAGGSGVSLTVLVLPAIAPTEVAAIEAAAAFLTVPPEVIGTAVGATLLRPIGSSLQMQWKALVDRIHPGGWLPHGHPSHSAAIQKVSLRVAT